ncbi:hypothetical protein R9X47_27950 [Wukongibacter baidiensis]|uniref:hypothetical protein n=1 Tax=Wukongibacter baidiensis TaxID=1723361 RepID=UPI003D7F64CC
MSTDFQKNGYPEEELYNDDAGYADEVYTSKDLTRDISSEEISAALQNGRAADYDDKYILKKLMEGLSREELALKLDHKSYRTLDMYMRRRGYKWDGIRQIYVLRPETNVTSPSSFGTAKAERVVSLFKAGIDPREIAKRVGMKDHRAMAMYMKSKGYIWSSEKQTYVLLKGEISTTNNNKNTEVMATEKAFILESEQYTEENRNISLEEKFKGERWEKLVPMLEMLDRNKDKLIQLLAINEGGTIPRYVVGGITITKSLCISHSLGELIKDFSKEKNISQKEIFEVAIIEFLKKYGYENEINALFVP